MRKLQISTGAFQGHQGSDQGAWGAIAFVASVKYQACSRRLGHYFAIYSLMQFFILIGIKESMQTNYQFVRTIDEVIEFNSVGRFKNGHKEHL